MLRQTNATGETHEAARGEALVRRGDATRDIPACESCHGSALTGVVPAIPGLLGLPHDYLAAQLAGTVLPPISRVSRPQAGLP